MKICNKKFVSVAFLGISLLSTFEACKIKNPTEGIGIYMKPDAVSAPNSFGFIDSKTGYTKSELEGFEVTITGPGSASLFTTDGFRTFKIVNGQIGVCVRRGMNPSMSNPIKFDIIFDKVGYLTKTTHVELTSLIPISQSISVLNLNDLPKTASKKDTSFTVGSGGLITPITITTPATDSLVAKSITLPAGTKFVDENKVPYSGTLSVSMLSSKSSGEDLGASPFGLEVPNLVDENGNTLLNKVFVPFNTYQLKISGGGKALMAYTADSNCAINPYSIAPNRVIINKDLSAQLVKDDPSLPANSTLTLNGVTANLEEAILQFDKPEYLPFYDIKLKFSMKNDYPEDFAIENTTFINASNNMKVKIFDGFFLPAGTTDHKLLMTQKWEGGSTIVGYLAPGVNSFNLVKPSGSTNFYITRFSVKCTNDGSFVVLPEGWEIYLIPKSVYDNTIVNGHKVQPADKLPSSYIKVNVGLPQTDKDEQGNNILYNLVKIPIASLKENTEYIVCTYFGSKGLIFNDFNNPNNPEGKLVTPGHIETLDHDFIDTPKSMSVKCN